MTRQEQEKMIREMWFPEHKAYVVQYDSWKTPVGQKLQGSPVEMLVWRKPGTSIYLTRYLWSNGYLFVTGDIGDAIYRFSAPSENAMRWVTGCDLQYFASKCEASEDGRGYRSWDSDEAKRELLEPSRHEWINPDNPAVALIKLKDAGAFDALNSKSEWELWLHENGNNLLGSDWWEWAPGIGMKIDIRCHGHLIGLKMAMAQLEGR